MEIKEKSAFITIVGRPNVGKSSLLNRILGQKVSIVSDKPQTTRTKIMGVYNNAENQLVFIDTPGFHKPRNILGQNMVKAVGDGMSDVDAVLFVVEAVHKFKLESGEIPEAEKALLGELKIKKHPAVLAINKIDLLEKKESLLQIITTYTSFYDFDAVVPVSAKSGDGTAELVEELTKYSKTSPHFFPNGEITDQPEKVMVAEIIREKLLRSLDKEVPHGIAVDLERFYEKDAANGEPILMVEATVYCERESHKGIIIGKNGEMLKNVGIRARKDIEEFFGIRASVKLWVKVKEDWRNRQGIIHTFGLD